MAGRESSRKYAVGWGTGGLGSFQNSPAPFQTGKLEQHPEGIPGDPSAQAWQPRRVAWGQGSRHTGPGLGSKVGSPERAGKPAPWGGKRRWDFSWGRNRTPPAGDNGSTSLNNSTPVEEGTQHPGDRRVKSARGRESSFSRESAALSMCESFSNTVPCSPYGEPHTH